MWHKASAFLRRWWWLLLAGFLVFLTMGRRRSVGLSAELLRRAHEADMDAELLRRRLNEESAQEIRQIRAELKQKLEAVEVAKIDQKAKLASDPGELLRYYQERGREL